jgi:hypothetical protein
MDIQTIVADLKAERNRIDQAISALEGRSLSSQVRRGRPTKAKQVGGIRQEPSSDERRRPQAHFGCDEETLGNVAREIYSQA